tara:strand:+ start:344 stop:1075 length:732 start_codon:yes stop_codon:yes gene_type:complete
MIKFTTTKAIVLIYFVVFGFVTWSAYQENQNEQEQFKNINKLNNDLIKISRFSETNATDITYLESKMNVKSKELDDINRRLIKLEKSVDTFTQMYFNTQKQIIASQGVETNPPPKAKSETPSVTDGTNVIDDSPPSVVSAPPPSTISTPREQEVTGPSIPSVISTASCPRPQQTLGRYINNITLRKDYSFTVSYDIIEKQVNNISFNKNLPTKLQKAIQKYLTSLVLTGDISGCKLPIKLLRG